MKGSDEDQMRIGLQSQWTMMSGTRQSQQRTAVPLRRSARIQERGQINSKILALYLYFLRILRGNDSLKTKVCYWSKIPKGPGE